MKDRQESVDSLLSSMKRENEALWREVAILRQKHLKQQQIVEKLLHFLVNIVRNQVVTTTGIKRKAPLMIDSSDNRKILKPNALDSVGDASSPGPIISDITDLEEGDLSLLDFELMKGNDSENGNALRNGVTNVLPGDFQGDFQGDLQGEIQSEVLSNEVSDVLQNEVPASTEVQGDFLPIEIQGDSTEQLLNDQDSVLNTPVISADQGIVASPNTNQSIVPINFAPMDPSINSNENFLNAGFDAGSPSTSTELIVPNQPTLAQLSPEYSLKYIQCMTQFYSPNSFFLAGHLTITWRGLMTNSTGCTSRLTTATSNWTLASLEWITEILHHVYGLRRDFSLYMPNVLFVHL